MNSEMPTPGSSRLRRVGGEFLRHALSYAPRFVAPRGKGYDHARAELRESEYWPAERLQELANARLRRLVTYAVQHVPYYRELFAREHLDPREIQQVSDLPKIPVLTREILLDRFEDLKSD